MTIYYTPDHDWIRVSGTTATVGVTKHAAEMLGDVVFVELKPVGAVIAVGGALGLVESVKAASDIYSPLTGKVVEINTRVTEEPGLVGTDAEGDGWLIKLEIADAAELSSLLDQQAYDALINAQ